MAEKYGVVKRSNLSVVCVTGLTSIMAKEFDRVTCIITSVLDIFSSKLDSEPSYLD